MSASGERSPPSLVAVIGAKGGCGCTLVAAHLAVAEASATSGRSVCLADFDFGRGDVGRALDLEDRDTLHPLVEHLGTWDRSLLDAVLQTHASGARVLTQPYDLAAILRLESAEFTRVLAGLRAHHDLVVADCGVQLDENTLSTLAAANVVVLVARADVPSLRSAQRVLTLCVRLGLPLERVALVLNDHRPTDMSVAEVERFLEMSAHAVLPHDPACREADTMGRLLWDVAPSSPLTSALEQLAASIGARRPVVDTATPLGALRRLLPWGRR